MDDHTVTTPMHEMRLVDGLDDEGDAVLSTTFVVTNTDGDLIPYMTGLAMLEAAKIDFVQRWRDATS